jgi:hypothetical protein
MDNLNYAVNITNIAVNTTPQDHSNWAAILNNFRNWLGRRFKWIGLINDFNHAVSVADIAVNITF